MFNIEGSLVYEKYFEFNEVLQISNPEIYKTNQ